MNQRDEILTEIRIKAPQVNNRTKIYMSAKVGTSAYGNILTFRTLRQIYGQLDQTAARGCEHRLGVPQIGKGSSGQVAPNRVQGQIP
ncbi:hypothetical protein PoB_001735300 [Plakobranchus ocellatus]|uniref:Uncharacterized protein n=1 Tax=Plakobranchus ocellatus TaxID=259542 RepID=A0AAV3Z8T3_9GAST|nr:hypothetical protein PoB_001735300 [Plakobranchus ocellatus]